MSAEDVSMYWAIDSKLNCKEEVCSDTGDDLSNGDISQSMMMMNLF
jgi:hypothetical protein